jgi:hypothetical protein
MLTYHFAVHSDTSVEDLGFMGLDGDNAAADFGEQIIRELLLEDHGKPAPTGAESPPSSKAVARSIRRSSSFSQVKASNSLRPAIWLRPESYSNELRKPATPPLPWLWARRTIPTCLQSSE